MLTQVTIIAFSEVFTDALANVKNMWALNPEFQFIVGNPCINIVSNLLIPNTTFTVYLMQLTPTMDKAAASKTSFDFLFFS